MARITVEDCLKHVSNPFKLVLIAAKLARALASGEKTSPYLEKHKPPVAALREIASRGNDANLLEEKTE